MTAPGDQPLSLEITRALCSGELDLSARPKAPRPGWDAMPEVVAARHIGATSGTDADVHVFLTLMSALDRARNTDRLWAAGVRTWTTSPWFYRPAEAVQRPQLDLPDGEVLQTAAETRVLSAQWWRRYNRTSRTAPPAEETHRPVDGGSSMHPTRARHRRVQAGGLSNWQSPGEETGEGRTAQRHAQRTSTDGASGAAPARPEIGSEAVR